MRVFISIFLGIGLAVILSAALAQDPPPEPESFTVLLDFDTSVVLDPITLGPMGEVPVGPIPDSEIYLSDPSGQLKVRVSRRFTGTLYYFDDEGNYIGFEHFDDEPIPISIENLAPFGGPASFVEKTLSPFDGADHDSPITIDIIEVPPGCGVEKVELEYGDFVPSDPDLMLMGTTTLVPTSVGTTFTPRAGFDPVGEPFGVDSVSRKRAAPIQSLTVKAGSVDFPNSVFYDNFVFTITQTEIPEGVVFSAGSDEPESDPGGDTPPSYGMSGGLPDNTPPVVTVEDNFSFLSENQSVTVVHATAVDAEGAAMTYEWFEEAPSGDVLLYQGSVTGDAADLPLSAATSMAIGDHYLRVEVSDGTLTSSEVIVVTVDNSPPDVTATGGGVYEIADPDGIPLGGSAADYDGDTLTYEWRWGIEVLHAGVVATLAGGDPVALPAHVIDTAHLGLGVHTLELGVDDGTNDEVVTQITVEVTDTTAPVMSLMATPQIMWPPNHTRRDVTVYADVSDNSGDPVVLGVEVEIVGNRLCDLGGFDPDAELVSIDSDSGVIQLLLRAEKDKRGRGRTYRITVTATDGSGNASMASVDVLVPHSKGKK